MMDDESAFIRHTNCEECGSSDANAVYSDGHTYCFSCESRSRVEGEQTMDDDVIEDFEMLDFSKYDTRGFEERSIPLSVSEHFGVKVGYDDDGKIAHHYYPYTKDGQVVGWKERIVDTKDFRFHGSSKGVELFGQNVAQGSNILVITEGELDAMSVARANKSNTGSYWAVVSIPSATSTKSIADNLTFVRSFKKVILAFDADEAGNKATAKAAKMIGSDKCFIAHFPDNLKDASDVLVQRGSKELDNILRSARPYVPAGIINAKDTWDQYVAEKSAVYTPWAPFLHGLNDKIYGRRLGSITMFLAASGSGKSSFCKEDLSHILSNTDDMVGVVSLEESVAETVRNLISIKLNKRVGLPGVETTEEEEREAFDELFGSDRVMLLDHQGSLSDDSLMDKMEHLAMIGCKYIYLDHITIAVAEMENLNQGIDQVMSDLLKLSKKYHAWIGVVSHLRKVGTGSKSFEDGADISLDDAKGSGSLKQISAQVIALSRNQQAENENDRHIVKVTVLKDRWTGDTGPAGYIRFNQDTGRMIMSEGPSEDGFEVIE